MTRDYGASEAAAIAADLDFFHALERRSYLRQLPQTTREALPGLLAGQEWRANDLYDAERGPGLVSVPTSPTRFAVAAQKLIGSFTPDPIKRRLARLRRSVGFAARSHLSERPTDDRCAMITLTYRRVQDWRPDHVSSFTNHVREHLRRRGIGFRYVWVAELQKRGAVHYHFAVFLPPGVVLPYPDSQGWWPHGSTRIEWARAAVPYLLKYLSKADDVRRFPRGLRSHGSGGQSDALKRAKAWLALPRFVQARASIEDRWTRVVGGGWRSPAGEYFRSEFERFAIAGVGSLRRVLTHPSTGFEPSGPFCWLNPERVNA